MGAGLGSGKPTLKNDFIGEFKGELREKYQILELLGSGAQGSAYKVRNKKTNKVYVAKETNGRSQKDRDSLMEEFTRMKELGYPCCVRVEELVTGFPIGASKSEKTFIISELARGSDLYKYVQENYTHKNTVPSEAWLAGIFKAAMLGVNFINSKGYVHNDLKPDNILVIDEFQHNEKIPRVVIADYGCMTVPNVNTFSYGDPRYQSPQVWSVMGPMMTEGAPMEDAVKAGPEADIWSMGVTLYELISGGLLPFLNRPCTWMDLFEEDWKLFDEMQACLADDTEQLDVGVSSDIKDASEHVRDLLGKMLHKDPKQRLSGKAVIDHRWFSEKLDEQMSTRAFRRLKFQSSRSTAQMVLRNALAHQLQRDHFENSWKAFKAVDQDHSGTIDREEFRECYLRLKDLQAVTRHTMNGQEPFPATTLPSMHESEPLKALDRRQMKSHTLPASKHNGGGLPMEPRRSERRHEHQVTRNERGKSFAIQDLPDCDSAFQEADVDGDGCLTFQEFTAATFDWDSVGEEALQGYLEELITTMAQNAEKDGKVQVKRRALREFFKQYLPLLTSSDLEDIIKKMDSNGDGYIDYNEMLSFLLDTEVEAESKLLEHRSSTRHFARKATQALGTCLCCGMAD
mmetsp:Transcript_1583/g.4069  ORF Transcript_1583/g.4069 Transcript_1583/m.4069 type:complete len:628 (-) Transcript_1583:107-1990(-)